jgi:hypothetical protein
MLCTGQRQQSGKSDVKSFLPLLNSRKRKVAQERLYEAAERRVMESRPKKDRCFP